MTERSCHRWHWGSQWEGEGWHPRAWATGRLRPWPPGPPRSTWPRVPPSAAPQRKGPEPGLSGPHGGDREGSFVARRLRNCRETPACTSTLSTTVSTMTTLARQEYRPEPGTTLRVSSSLSICLEKFSLCSRSLRSLEASALASSSWASSYKENICHTRNIHCHTQNTCRIQHVQSQRAPTLSHREHAASLVTGDWPCQRAALAPQ